MYLRGYLQGSENGRVVTIAIIILWDEVPTMVEIAIFRFQIHITNGLNFMHQKPIHGSISAQKISTLF
jgi:hypothetical protein